MTKTYSENDLLESAHSTSFPNVILVDHPLVRSVLSILRDTKTPLPAFRLAVHALTPHLIYAATHDLPEKTKVINTPLAPHRASVINAKVVLIPILRSGIGMHEPTQTIFPDAPTIFAGMARDEATAIPHWYYDLKELPHLVQGRGVVFLVLDPMLATGGSALETISRIKSIYPKGTIKMISMIAAPEGINTLHSSFPEVEITVAAIDSHLNSHKYIVPGLGDAGDRQFGTL